MPIRSVVKGFAYAVGAVGAVVLFLLLDVRPGGVVVIAAGLVAAAIALGLFAKHRWFAVFPIAFLLLGMFPVTMSLNFAPPAWSLWLKTVSAPVHSYDPAGGAIPLPPRTARHYGFPGGEAFYSASSPDDVVAFYRKLAQQSEACPTWSDDEAFAHPAADASSDDVVRGCAHGVLYEADIETAPFGGSYLAIISGNSPDEFFRTPEAAAHVGDATVLVKARFQMSSPQGEHVADGEALVSRQPFDSGLPGTPPDPDRPEYDLRAAVSMNNGRWAPAIDIVRVVEARGTAFSTAYGWLEIGVPAATKLGSVRPELALFGPANDGRIARVVVALDGDPPQPATLGEGAWLFTARKWHEPPFSVRVKAFAGDGSVLFSHELTVRASR